MGGWGSVRSLLWLYDIFISYHSYLHLCHHYLHHCLFFFCSQSCRIFLIVEQESISLGQTGARWVDGWMRVSTVTAIWYIHILSVLSTSMSSLSTSLSILFLFPILQDFLLLSKSSSVWVRPVLGGWMGGWGSVRSLLWLYDIFISYHSYLHLCHHYLHHCLFFFCSQSCRIFLIVEQESISLGQTGARWVDGWMREHGHCYGYMIYLYLIVLIYIYVIIIYIIVYSFLFPILQDFLLLSKSSSVWVRPVLGEAVDSPAGSQDL